MLTPLLIAALVGYLLGALPFGYLVARSRGVNIFEVGSKSPGATNVKRVLGKKAGNLVFVCDVLKGGVAAAWALAACADATWQGNFDGGWAPFSYAVTGDDWVNLGVAGLIGALFGHSFSCFTRFKGGKGVATAAGGFLVLLPLATLMAAVVWVATFYLSRYVSLASILAALALPVGSLTLERTSLLTGFAALIAVFVIIRHRANISRLLAGTENKFVKKPTPANRIES